MSNEGDTLADRIGEVMNGIVTASAGAIQTVQAGVLSFSRDSSSGEGAGGLPEFNIVQAVTANVAALTAATEKTASAR